MARRRKPQRKRTPKDRFFAFFKTLRQVFQPGRHRTGDRTLSQRRRQNPWPKCQTCRLRNPPEDLCQHCLSCPGCCDKCPKCGRCMQVCPGHPRGGDQADSTGPNAH